MKKFYRARCHGCDRNFRVEKLKKMGIDTPYGSIEIDIENVIQNNYSKVIDTPQGKATIELKDLSLGLICPFCKADHQYSLRSLVVTDRLD